MCTWHSRVGAMFSRLLDLPTSITNPAPEERVKSVLRDNAPTNPLESKILKGKYPEDVEFGRVQTPPAVDLWKYVTERVPTDIGLNTRSGNITLGSMLHKGEKSAVYGIVNNPNYVIKYNRYTPGKYILEPIDPILREAHFLEMVNKIPGLTNKLLFYSAAAPSPAVVGKLTADKSPQPNQTVRYMITEKVGKSLEQYRNVHGGVIGVKDAVKIGIEMMNLVQQLHREFNVIHGDVHPGNFAVDPKTGRLVMIDFGHSRIVDMKDFPEGEFTPIHAQVKNKDQTALYTRVIQSQWEDRFLVSSFRDDIYRVLFSMAFMIHGYPMDDMIRRMCTRVRETTLIGERRLLEGLYYEIKSRDNFFDADVFKTSLSTSQFKDIEPFPARLPDEILSHFERTLHILRQTQISQKPNYEGIINELQIILIDIDQSSTENVDFGL